MLSQPVYSHFKIRDLEYDADKTKTPDSPQTWGCHGKMILKYLRLLDGDLSEGDSEVLPVRFVKKTMRLRPGAKNYSSYFTGGFRGLCRGNEKAGGAHML